MLWAIAAYIAHIIEMSILSLAVKDIGPLIVMPIFYFFVFSFLFINNVIQNKTLKIAPFEHIKNHKTLFSTFITGGLIGNILWFSSLYFLGIGAITFILVFIRVFVTAYSYFFMNDRYPIDKTIAIITTFFAVFAFSFGGEFDSLLGAGLAALSCIGFTVETISRKKLALTPIEPKDTIILRSIILGVFTFTLMLILNTSGISEYTQPETKDVIFIALAALFGGLPANIFIFFALRTMQLSYIEALNATKPVAMTMIGLLFLSETVTTLQIIFGGIIIISSLYFLLPTKEQKPSNS